MKAAAGIEIERVIRLIRVACVQSRVATNSPLTANAAPRFSGALQAHVDATASAWRFVSDASEWMTEEGVEVEEASTRSVDAAEAVGTM